MKSVLIAAAIFLVQPCWAAKIGFVFNGGGLNGEGNKNALMEAESLAAVKRMKGFGYNVDGNVFIRDGGARAGVSGNKPADAAELLRQIEAACAKGARGDEVAISFSGHGIQGEDTSQVLQNQFVGYTSPNEPVAVDYSAADKALAQTLNEETRRVLEAYKDYEMVSGIRLAGATDSLNERFADAQTRLNTAVASLAQKAGVSPGDIQRVIGQMSQYHQIDLLPPTMSSEMVDKVANFVAYAARPENRGQDQRGVLRHPNPTLNMADLKKAVEKCTAKGIRVRMSSTNCYSGGLLDLTDDKGLVCAVSQTNPYSTAAAFGLWNAPGNNQSLATMRNAATSAIQDENTFLNNDPSTSSDYIVATWVDKLADHCADTSAGGLCVSESNKSKICGAMNSKAPRYFKRSPDGVDADALPQSIIDLADKVPNRPDISLPVDARNDANLQTIAATNQGLAEHMKTAGFDIYNDQYDTEEALLAAINSYVGGLQSSAEKAAAFRAAALPLGPPMDGVIRATISESGQLSDTKRLSNVLNMWITKNMLESASINQLKKNPNDVAYRREVYNKLFEQYATEPCRGRHRNAQSCENASLVDGTPVEAGGTVDGVAQ